VNVLIIIIIIIVILINVFVERHKVVTLEAPEMRPHSSFAKPLSTAGTGTWFP